MNHLNCFVIGAMAKSMNGRFSGLVLKDGYSNSPDHLLLDFGTASFSCLFYRSEVFFSFNPDAEAKSRLYKPQFSDLHGLALISVTAQRFERSFIMAFENNYKLLFVCHGRKSNVVLFHGDQNLDVFRKMHSADNNLHIADFKDRPVDINALQEGPEPVTACPFLPDEFYAMAPLSIPERFSRLSNIDGFDVQADGNGLIPVYGRHSVLEDLSRFAQRYLRDTRFADTRQALLETTEKSIAEKEAFIRSNTTALEAIRNNRSSEELGNILLAGMHLIQPGTAVAVLPDIYLGADIAIKLDPKLNPVENAERYFRKAKGIPHAVRLLEEKIAQAEKALQALREKQKSLQAGQSWKDLKPFIKEADKRASGEELPYRRFVFQGYDILVGKHAESNEKLLNYYSDKDDVWMHAKDVAGSHVLIKSGRKAALPEAVMEAGAALAAYYSKNRKQSLVTVTWTLRKYVRKIKGAEKGKVSISNEKTLLVKPGLPVT